MGSTLFFYLEAGMVVKQLRLGLVILALVFGLAWWADAAKAVEVKASPRFATAPATIRLTVRIEPNVDHRFVCIGYDGGGKSRESCMQIEADDRPTRWVDFREVPGGRYAFYAVVVAKDGRQEIDAVSVCVQGSVKEGYIECGEPEI